MKKLLVAILAILSIAGPAHAFLGESGMVEQFEYVADTQIPSSAGPNMALCYQTYGLHIFGFAITSNIEGYALVNDDCEGSERRQFTAEQMQTAQSLHLVAVDIPTVARNDFQRNLSNYGLWIGLALALFAVIWRRMRSILGYDVNGPLRKKAAQRVLTAMCYAAKCDGLVSSEEIKAVSKTVFRLTQHRFAPADIMRAADRIDMNLSAQDYIDFGKGLRDREKDVMMQAVLSVLIADGRMLPVEHEFATELAHGLGMPAEDFRRVLNIAMADM